ncbi:hypothetical protein [Yinghuangia seranimata]|uniref:hypothetical protein n=1 Tax=Yinghuangia seranimata TaxID=408067 RepID=UPI00248BF01A|nr:hypothetical protein [Yinghuangia seranimata]MDI2132290.1 hypothetical protein [Yinghuangia seranimata]
MLAFLGLVLAALAAPATAATSAPSPKPSASDNGTGPASLSLDPGKSKADAVVRVTGAGWPKGALVNISVCGQNALGGTRTCALPSAVQTPVSDAGMINVSLKVALPPVPCPCVVRAVTVTGTDQQDHTAPLEIEGAPFAALPADVKTPGRLVFLTSKMTGKDTLFTWFGSPVSRRFEIEVGNMGQSPIVNPRFKIATFEGVFAPTWSTWDWQGTINPGQRVTVKIPIELEPRQHGQFRYRVMYENQVVDEQVLNVGRPWGVYLFGGLLIVVAPMTVWRLGVSLVGAVRSNREERAIEKDRAVGLPGGSVIKEAAGKRGGSAPAETPSPATAPEPAREPVLAVGGGTPRRSVSETVVISGPLFSESSAKPSPASDSPAVDTTSSTAVPAPPPVAPPSPEPAPGRRVVRPEDVARGLAWNPGEGDDA